MIGHLQGTVLSVRPQQVLLDVGGVGYAIQIALSTYAEIERRGVGGSLALFIHTHVRDDALLLFGFLSPNEKALFERLIAVSGIGPKLAQAILSGMPPADLIAAIAEADLPRLVAIPGVGKKTAERLVLELRDKVADLVTPDAAASGVHPHERASRDAVDALVHLGYRTPQAQRAVAAVRGDQRDQPVAELVRAALRHLAGG